MGTRSNPILRRAIAVDYTEVYRYGSYINFSTEVLQNVIQLKSTYIYIICTYILYAYIDLSRIAYIMCAPVFGSYKMIEIAMDFHFANPCLCDR